MTRLIVLLVAAAWMSACHVANRPYNLVPNSVVTVRTTPGGTHEINKDCNPIEDPCLAFVEFDDMGEAWDVDALPGTKTQLDAAVELIHRAKTGDLPPIIVVFIHGWKNNAGLSNGNVIGLEGVLEFMHRVKYRTKVNGVEKPFPIVGVYIGWRGDLVQKAWPVRRQLSYFNREDAAIRIPGASMTNALTRIMMETHKPPAVRTEREIDPYLIMVGHSFGALVLERALTQAMTDVLLRFREEARGEAPQRRSESTADGALADLVVYVNSAAAANEGKQMLDLLKGTAYTAPPDPTLPAVRPLFLSISSLGDAATRFALPVGHGPSFLSRKIKRGWRSYDHPPGSPLPRAQTAYYLSTVAHMEALQSHFLVETAPAGQPRTDRCATETPYKPQFQAPNQRWYQICERSGRWNDTPYWAMQMPASIVPDHSGIFNANLLRVLEEFFYTTTEMVEPVRRPSLRVVPAQ